jgi:DNA-binding transcriptional ArsR family regulator
MKSEPSEIFKVLSVETRVKIIELLKSRGPLGAKDIAATIGITTASERKGYWIPYSIDEKAMEDCRQILNEVCTCGCQGTGKFKEVELGRSSLESLKDYEKGLKNELNTVRQRVRELESTKR